MIAATMPRSLLASHIIPGLTAWMVRVADAERVADWLVTRGSLPNGQS